MQCANCEEWHERIQKKMAKPQLFPKFAARRDAARPAVRHPNANFNRGNVRHERDRTELIYNGMSPRSHCVDPRWITTTDAWMVVRNCYSPQEQRARSI